MDPGIIEFTPPIDATVVQLLTDSGASIVGKTNCDEFGMGYVPSSTMNYRVAHFEHSSLNIHSVHGAVVNPYHSESSESRSAGGSSGGSAAAAAAGFCDAYDFLRMILSILVDMLSFLVLLELIPEDQSVYLLHIVASSV